MIGEEKQKIDATAKKAKFDLDSAKFQEGGVVKLNQQQLKEKQFEHKRQLDIAELQILKTTEDVRGIASP